MANRRQRLTFSRSRMRQQQRRRLIKALAIAAAVLVLIIILIILLARGGGNDAVETLAATATPEPTPEVQVTDTPEPTQSTELSSQPAVADPQLAAARAATRPTPATEGRSPIFSEANTEEKIIAITVDDCFQAGNLRNIVDTALSVGGKLTIFPIGKNVLRSEVAEVLVYAYEHGFELENHTFTHNGLYRCSDAEMAEEVYKQQMTLCYILNKEYQPHFLRPCGGDARRDQRMQQYAMQLGYYGIAHWSASGGAGREDIAKALKPGAIYLFHCTDNDWDKLRDFIPWVASKGYQMVTLNEMFGYPENETAPLTVPITEHKIPDPVPFTPVYLTLKKTTYSYVAYQLQEKLIAMGYLTGEPDGIYGADCEKAVKKYQQDHNLEATGKADPDLLASLLNT